VSLGFGRIFIGRFLFLVILSRTADLGEVSSALLRAQLSLALVGYELTGLQVQVQVTDGQSVSKSWCQASSGAHDQIFITV
jgi:hypothetical protein